MIPVAKPSLTDHEKNALIEAWDSTFISGAYGPHLEQFECTFSKIAGTKYGVAVSNGTVAIDLLLRALCLEPGEEVLLPAWTYVATAAATVAAGGVPVLVDCDEWGCIDAQAIRAAVVPGKTRFVWVVHLYGRPCDMDSIMKVANEYNLIVLEDAAEAHGAMYKQKPVGSFGMASTFSFFANKIITTGEGGMVCTDDLKLAERVRYLSRHAMSTERRFFHTEIGFNYRLSNLLCAIGCAQVERFPEIVARRNDIIQYYRNALDGFCGICINPVQSDIVLAPWLACVILPDNLCCFRDDICHTLQKKFKVDTRPFFIPLHTMPPYESYRRVNKNGDNTLTMSNKMCTKGFNLPTWVEITKSELDSVIEATQNTIIAITPKTTNAMPETISTD